jgi:hypothetical protein
LDSEFIALSLFFILMGAVGIIMFYGPMTSSGDSCYCLIPSPEPGAAQGTSSILLVLGILFFPMGLLKGGPPSFFKRQTGPPKQIVLPSGRVYTPISLASGRLFAFGILLVVVGFDLALVPGFIVLKSVPVIGIGAVITALGLAAVYFGWRKPKSPTP